MFSDAFTTVLYHVSMSRSLHSIYQLYIALLVIILLISSVLTKSELKNKFVTHTHTHTKS